MSTWEHSLMLRMDRINAFYGKVRVLWDLTLKIDEKEIVALVGGNGAGKTTTLHTIVGLVRPASGSLELYGKRIDGMPPYQVVQLGICYIPEGGKPFPDMTVRENLEMGAYPHTTWKKKEETLDQVYQIFPRLKERARQLARTLSGGERQMLAMARGLMSKPKLSMFDEPSYGLAPLLVKVLFQFIRDFREQGMTILLVEQNVRQALEIADRAYVLENGRIVLEGESKGLLQNVHVKKAYLGL
jgi:branched-chain amino acid transport system ATP-binding protein